MPSFYDYRIVKHPGGFAIHEVALDDDGNVIGCEAEKLTTLFEDAEDIVSELGRYAEAVVRTDAPPVLDSSKQNWLHDAYDEKDDAELGLALVNMIDDNTGRGLDIELINKFAKIAARMIRDARLV